jgi:hypothetical protein
MKKFMNISAGVLLCVCTCFASEVCAAGGRIIITPSTLEVGEVDEGRVITGMAVVENTGIDTVQITNIRTN